MLDAHRARPALVRRTLLDRGGAPAAVSLIAVAALGWLYLLAGAAMYMPEGGASEQMMAQGAWSTEHTMFVLTMWVIMMGAMMLPSAVPTILLHRAITRKRGTRGGADAKTSLFAGGYLLAWAGFSLVATGVQWVLWHWGLLNPMAAVDNELLGAAFLAAAGLYQLSPLKHACLRQCRSPLTFLAKNWQANVAGTLCMGLRHGLYCIGCCWALMTLLFAGGIMNMLWIIGLTVFVLIEKQLISRKRTAARLSGWTLIGAAALWAAM